MARVRSLADLLTDVADRLDVPAFTETTFVSVDTMTRWLNQSVRRFDQMLIDAYGSEHFAKSASISVVAGTASYALPSDYLQTLYMRVTLDGEVYGIHHAELDDLGIDPNSASGWSLGCRPRFRQQGANMVFTPTPRAAHTVTHLYVPTLFVTDDVGAPKAELVDGDDLLEGYNGWEEWPILDCCRKHKAAEDQDPSLFVMEMQEIEREIKAGAQKRDREPRRVRNTYNRGRA